MAKQGDYPRKRSFYEPFPDYTGPLYEIPSSTRERMRGRLAFLYGERIADRYMPELERILKVHYAHKPPEMLEKEKNYDPKERFTDKDMILITYGDIIKGDGDTPLAALHNFVNNYNLGAFNTIHLLPFFPYSSDRGFAVVDFRRVDPKLGTWADILEKKKQYDLMFDAVLNHVSSMSEMFMEFRNGNPRYVDFFIAFNSPDDLTQEQRKRIFRPRTSDILTRYETINGPKWVWTTFSEDQIDLNFRNPALLMQVLESVLFYIRHGADILRLDAVTYLWDEPGTEGIHLPQTHEIVKLVRDVIDAVGSGVALVTETNVPHRDNVAYFGNGYDEAHMVYNFALPPLVLHAFYREDASYLSRWAEEIESPSNLGTFLNILDTHDGIGLMGAKDILPGNEIDFIIQTAKERGGYISYKTSEDCTEEPYEINTTWWSAVNDENADDDLTLQVRRYLASRSVSLVLKGVPGIYVHGAIGTANDHERVRQTGIKRDVNRGVIDAYSMEENLRNPDSKISLLRNYGGRMNLIRTQNRAFHPRGRQKVFKLSPHAFVVLRASPEGDEHILTMTNVTGREIQLDIILQEVGIHERIWLDLIGERYLDAEGGRLRVTLSAYDVAWLKPVKEIEGKGWL
ncbi:MAG: sugar phosphorylase [Deltaproteobacteria bacterium]|nr:sugar phosphorylase [Deltaproteobacteria bacterium]